MNESSPTKIRIVFGLVLALGVSTLMMRKSQQELIDSRHLIKYEIVWWVTIVALLLYVHFGERRPLSSVGYRRLGLRGVGIAIAAGVLLMAGLALIYYIVVPALHLNMPQQVNKLLALPLWCRLDMVKGGSVSGGLRL